MNLSTFEYVIKSMTAQQPGVETTPALDALWSPALARGLIRNQEMRLMRYRDGYTDLLGPSEPAKRSLAQRAMNSPIIAAIYERVWRPILIGIMSLHGLSITAEREKAASALNIEGNLRVLDVGCGPGNFTSFFANRISGDGFVIGLDNSEPMMARAVRDNSCARAVYMRADAADLPFNNKTFDVVCCFAALHLMQDPIKVLDEMVRVLSPGGRIAVTTSYGRDLFLVRKAIELGAKVCGVRVFDRSTLPDYFAAAGLTDIDQKFRGTSQFVIAHKPAEVTEIGRARARLAGRGSRRPSIRHSARAGC